MSTTAAEIDPPLYDTRNNVELSEIAALGKKPYLTIVPARGWAPLNLRELWQFRDLLMSLAKRDLKLRYKQTFLGVLWVVLQPLLAAGIFSFVFGKLAKFPSEGVPYFLFSYAGLLGWNLFSSTLTKTSTCLITNNQLISKVFFPRLVLPLSTVPSVLIDFAVAMSMMIVMMALYAPRPPGWALLLLPVWMVIILLIALGVGIGTAAVAVTYRDVQYIMPVLVQILLYASPIAYGLTKVMSELSPGLRLLFLANPLSGPLEAFRWSLLDTARPPVGCLIYSAVFSVVAFVFGACSFKRMERKFADVI